MSFGNNYWIANTFPHSTSQIWRKKINHPFKLIFCNLSVWHLLYVCGGSSQVVYLNFTEEGRFREFEIFQVLRVCGPFRHEVGSASNEVILVRGTRFSLMGKTLFSCETEQNTLTQRNLFQQTQQQSNTYNINLIQRWMMVMKLAITSPCVSAKAVWNTNSSRKCWVIGAQFD